MYKKGSVVFRDVRMPVSKGRTRQDSLADKGQYELVEPASHNAEEEADNLAEPIQQSKTKAEHDRKKRAKARITIEHLDIIKDDFWDRRPWLLSGRPGTLPKQP